MDKIPQKPVLVQSEGAAIALSGGSPDAPLEGHFVDTSGGVKRGAKARSKTRSDAPPQDRKIVELEKQVSEQKRAIEDHVLYRLEQGKKIVKLERELAEAKKGHSLLINIAELESRLKWEKEANQALAASRNEWAETAETRLQKINALNADLAQAQAQAEQNAHIATEEHEERLSVMAENTDLRTELAEAHELHHDEIACQGCAAKDRRITHLEELQKSDNQYIMRLQNELRWTDELSKGDKIEPGARLVARAMREAIKGKGEHYTPLYRDDIAQATGLSPNTAGKHMNALVEWGMFSGYRVPEKASVPDRRLGKREIKKEILHVASTDILEHPKDWERGDGKQHGGAGNRCKKCHSENTLRRVYHTVCLECGAEDIAMPDDARIALDKARAIEADDAPAAVAEAVAIFAQVQPGEQIAPGQAVEISEVQDELQSETAQEATPDTMMVAPLTGTPATEVQDELQSRKPERTDVMTLARRAGFPALNLPELGIKIDADSSAWAHWTHMEHPTNAQISAVQAHFLGTPEPWDTPCTYCDSTETVWDPSGDGRRITACYVYPERRKPQTWDVQATPAHKSIDFTNGKIIEVRDEK